MRVSDYFVQVSVDGEDVSLNCIRDVLGKNIAFKYHENGKRSISFKIHQYEVLVDIFDSERPYLYFPEDDGLVLSYRLGWASSYIDIVRHILPIAEKAASGYSDIPHIHSKFLTFFQDLLGTKD